MTPPSIKILPNALTSLRLGLAVVFVVLLSSGSLSATMLSAAAVLFVVAALTDALDGWLARRLNAITPFGRVMDPFADKVLVLSAFVLLAGPGFHDGEVQLSRVQPWMAIVVLARELLVTSLRGLVESRGGDFSATVSGKLKMIVQSIAVPAILACVAIGEGWSPDAAAIIAWIVTIVTIWSGAPYVMRAIPLLKESPG